MVEVFNQMSLAFPEQVDIDLEKVVPEMCAYSRIEKNVMEKSYKVNVFSDRMNFVQKVDYLFIFLRQDHLNDLPDRVDDPPQILSLCLRVLYFLQHFVSQI